jgi:hypothetical protein
METSGDRTMKHPATKRITNNAGVGVGVKLLAIAMLGAGTLRCQPGALTPCDNEPDLKKCYAPGDGGGASNGGSSGNGGASANGGTGGTPPAPECKLFSTTNDVEDKIILPKCGKPGDATCHATGPFFPKMTAAGMIVDKVLDVKSTLKCSTDKYVNKLEPEKSFFLGKLKKTDAEVKCADGIKAGGPKMPYDIPDGPKATPLTADEDACLRWWVMQIVK